MLYFPMQKGLGVPTLDSHREQYLAYKEDRIKGWIPNPKAGYNTSEDFSGKFNEEIKEEALLDSANKELIHILRNLFQYLITNYNNHFPKKYSDLRSAFGLNSLNFRGYGYLESRKAANTLIQTLLEELSLEEILSILRYGNVGGEIVIKAYMLLYTYQCEPSEGKSIAIPEFDDLKIKLIGGDALYQRYWGSPISLDIGSITDVTMRQLQIVKYFTLIGCPPEDKIDSCILGMEGLINNYGTLSRLGVLSIEEDELGRIDLKILDASKLRSLLDNYPSRIEQITRESLLIEFKYQHVEGVFTHLHLHSYYAEFMCDAFYILILDGKTRITADELLKKCRVLWESEQVEDKAPGRKLGRIVLLDYSREDKALIQKLIDSTLEKLEELNLPLLSITSIELLNALIEDEASQRLIRDLEGDDLGNLDTDSIRQVES